MTRVDTFYNAFQILCYINSQDPLAFLTMSDLRRFAREGFRGIARESFSDKHLIPALEELSSRGLVEIAHRPRYYEPGEALYRINANATEEVREMLKMIERINAREKQNAYGKSGKYEGKKPA